MFVDAQLYFSNVHDVTGRNLSSINNFYGMCRFQGA
jgi:hypothetical protein